MKNINYAVKKKKKKEAPLQKKEKRKKKKAPNYQSKQDAYPKYIKIKNKKKGEMLIHKFVGLNNL